MRDADDMNPFLGLVPFASGDVLFARDRDVELIQSRIWASRVTVLFAGSGVGKSSFLNAKLIGALQEWFGKEYVATPGCECWARADPSKAFSTASATLRDLPATRNGGIIVLDQFEEVFQYFPNPAALRSFGEELAAAVDEQSSLNVRLLISIREEFLAQLTALDDFIPSVLTNYYRLRKFTRKQARLVIEATARLRGIDTSDRIDALLADLSTVEHGNRSTSGLFVDPPYLQIVCHRMWENEDPKHGHAFLSTYREGEARHELEAYCREKLNAHLTQRRRFLVRRALEHLTGPHEAKKFVRVSDLARELGQRDPATLTAALEPLTAPDVRLLRGWTEYSRTEADCETSAPKDGAAAPSSSCELRRVYQLYHDMYAPMLWRWKEEQASAERQSTILKSVVAATLAAVLLLFGVLAPGLRWWFVGRPDIAHPIYGSADQMAGILEMRAAFARTIVLRPIGDLLLRQYMDKLATIAAMKMDTDEAISYRLMARAASSSREGDARDVLGPAADLLATEDVAGAVDAVVMREADSQSLRVATLDGRIITKPLQSKDRPEIRFAPAGLLALSRSGHYAIVVRGAPGSLQFSRFEVASASNERQLDAAVDPGGGASQPIGVLAGSFSDDEGRAVVIENGRVSVLEPDDFGEWQPWNPLHGLRAEITRAAIVGDWLAVTWRDLDDKQRIARWDLAAPPAQRVQVDLRKCFLPATARLVLKKNGSVLAYCEESAEWSWVSASGQPQDIKPPFATAPTLFPQQLDEQNSVLVSLDVEGRLVFSAIDSPGTRPYVLPISERRRYPAPEYRRFSSSPHQFVGDGTLVTIDDNVVRVWKTANLPKRLAAPSAAPAMRRSAQMCQISDGYINAAGSAARWKLRASLSAEKCGKSESRDGSRILVYLPAGFEYGARGADTLVRLPSANDAALGPGNDEVSMITAGIAPELLIYGLSKMGKLEKRWSLPCNNCRFLGGADDKAVVVHSDFWIFRVAEAESLLVKAEKQWPQIDAVFWHERVTELRAEEPGDTRRVVVNGSDVIDFSDAVARQRGYSLDWASMWSAPWRTARDLDYECRSESSASAALGIALLCDWEHRSKGTHADASQTPSVVAIHAPKGVTSQASLKLSIGTGQGARR